MDVPDIMGVPAKSVSGGASGMIESQRDGKLGISPSPLGCPAPSYSPIYDENYLLALNETLFLELASWLTSISSEEWERKA